MSRTSPFRPLQTERGAAYQRLDIAAAAQIMAQTFAANLTPPNIPDTEKRNP